MLFLFLFSILKILLSSYLQSNYLKHSQVILQNQILRQLNINQNIPSWKEYNLQDLFFQFCVINFFRLFCFSLHQHQYLIIPLTNNLQSLFLLSIKLSFTILVFEYIDIHPRSNSLIHSDLYNTNSMLHKRIHSHCVYPNHNIQSYFLYRVV